MGSINCHAEVNTVDPLLVPNQRIVCSSFLCSYSPDLDSLIERSTSEHLWVFRVDSNLHDIVIVVFIRVDSFPLLVPIKELDGLIIRTTEHIRHLGMYCNVSNEVSMLFNGLELFTSVIVEDSKLVIV